MATPHRPPPAQAALALVEELLPGAEAAWLAGSVLTGEQTVTSDLDVTVLMPDDDTEAPYRLSVDHAGWPAELFVHTAASVREYVARDRARRRPTMARLVGAGVLLLDGTGAGAELTREAQAALASGPEALSGEETDAARYALTDLLDDLAGDPDPLERTAVAVALWSGSGDLLLAGDGRWGGTGKWLVRELRGFDAAHGTAYAGRLAQALAAAVAGSPGALVEVVDEILARHGGRLRVGYRREGARS